MTGERRRASGQSRGSTTRWRSRRCSPWRSGPLVTFGLGRGRAPLASLAVWPVVNSTVFLFRSGGVAFQEVAIALGGGPPDNERQVRRTGNWLGALASLALATLAFSPLEAFWFQRVSGLAADLASFSTWPLRILVLLPALEFVLSIQRARWIVARRTVSGDDCDRRRGGGPGGVAALHDRRAERCGRRRRRARDAPGASRRERVSLRAPARGGGRRARRSWTARSVSDWPADSRTVVAATAVPRGSPPPYVRQPHRLPDTNAAAPRGSWCTARIRGCCRPEPRRRAIGRRSRAPGRGTVWVSARW